MKVIIVGGVAGGASAPVGTKGGHHHGRARPVSLTSHLRKSPICLSALLLIFPFAPVPSGRLLAQQPPAAPAAASPAQDLDQLTGPIALYPDAIVIQILRASQNYDTVKLFAGWLEKNANLKASELQDAAEKIGFSEPLVALAPFPQIVKMMIEKPDWTKALGQAVTADKMAVSDSIQRMRTQAQSLGNLKTTPQQVVTVTNTVIERTVEQQVVVVTNTIVQIQPANPQVIYVPTYPQTVYVQPAPPPSSASVAGAALVGFTAGVIVAGAHDHHYHHHYEEYWDAREDYYEDRQQNAQQNQDQRQSNAQANQDQRQSNAQANQDQRQSNAEGRQEQRQPGAPGAQSQGTASRQSSAQVQGTAPRPSATPSAQPQGAAQRPSAAPSAQFQPTASPAPRPSGASSYPGGASPSSQRSGMSSGGPTSYQSGSATRTQSSRGSSSMASSRSSAGRSSGGRRGR